VGAPPTRGGGALFLIACGSGYVLVWGGPKQAATGGGESGRHQKTTCNAAGFATEGAGKGGAGKVWKGVRGGGGRGERGGGGGGQLGGLGGGGVGGKKKKQKKKFSFVPWGCYPGGVLFRGTKTFLFSPKKRGALFTGGWGGGV